jgi:ankyrin repeat protein
MERLAEIQQACRLGDLPAVTRLLDASLELLSPALWPPTIFEAKSVDLTRLLLDRGLNPNECSAPRRPLHLAVYQCLPDVIDLLIERGADVNQINPLGERPIDLLDAYEPRPFGDPDARRIRASLLNAGAKDDVQTAVRAGDLAEVRRMLDGDPSLIGTQQPWPPLFSAARSGRVEAAKLLIERGADVNASNAKSNTPLWFACQSPARAEDRIAVSKLLIEFGARANEICEDGTTALHFAAWRGPATMVELLLAHHVDASLKDRLGNRPLDFALRGNASDKQSIIGLLGVS